MLNLLAILIIFIAIHFSYLKLYSIIDKGFLTSI